MFTNAQSPAVPKREKPRRVRLLSFRLLHLRRRAVCCPSRCARGERGGFRLPRIRKISARNARISPSSRIRRRMIDTVPRLPAASACASVPQILPRGGFHVRRACLTPLKPSQAGRPLPSGNSPASPLDALSLSRLYSEPWAPAPASLRLSFVAAVVD